MAGWEQLTREQLLVVVGEQSKVIEQQSSLIEQLSVQVSELTARVAELTRQLGQNSGNSSLPPSADRGSRPSRPVRGRSTRKPGKQPGAPGSSLGMVADPDEVVDHVPVACSGCGAGLADAADAGVVVRQVRDVPPVQIRVTEHRLHKRACGCGTVTTATAPAGVDGPVGYGPNLRTLAVYLVVYQHVPVERAARLIADVTGATVSTGWVSGQVARCAEALADVEALIKTLISLATVIGVDETTVNIAGTTHWLHVARTDLLTAYYRHANRGRVAVDKFAILPAYHGTVVHDSLSVYDCYPADHALCGAHLLRELTAAAETHPGQHWPGQARHALADLARLAANSRGRGEQAIPADLAAGPLKLYRHAVLVGLAEHRRQPGRKQTKTRNLLERLKAREADLLRFVDDVTVPFTNNGSERDLRPAKTQRKISGSHRADTGADNWLRIRGYISTVRKHGADIYTALNDAITGNPWKPPQAAPAT